MTKRSDQGLHLVVDQQLSVDSVASRLIDQHFTGVKTRSCRPGHTQRAAAGNASQADNDEAYLVGQAAVQAAISGMTDKMVTLTRGDTDGYSCETGLADLSEIANGVNTNRDSGLRRRG